MKEIVPMDQTRKFNSIDISTMVMRNILPCLMAISNYVDYLPMGVLLSVCKENKNGHNLSHAFTILLVLVEVVYLSNICAIESDF